ncbi:DEAD/DEAH box helicase family protein [Erysipelotrichaceae bacterium RD49]|nr:DEAD/DEAH box helicase family protein [Erysipelotrichaceae bacterium RD49]
MDEKAYLQEIARLYTLLEAHHIDAQKPAWVREALKRLVPPLKKPDPRLFLSHFRARMDHFYCVAPSGAVYVPCAIDGSSQCPKSQQGFVYQAGVSPCKNCLKKQNQLLDLHILNAYLSKQSDRPYPQLKICLYQENGTTFLMAFDFARLQDCPLAKQQELADKLQRTARRSQLDCLKVVNADGKSVTLWLFFEQAVDSTRAIEFGQMLVLRAIKEEALDDLEVFDCIIPNRLPRTPGDPGWSVELPLYPPAMRQRRSVWMDENWNPVVDVWKRLENTQKISPSRLDAFLRAARKERLKDLLELKLPDEASERDGKSDQQEASFDYAPALFETGLADTKQSLFHASDVKGVLRIHNQGSLRIDTSNLAPRLKTALLLMGSCWNPEFAGKNTRFAAGLQVLSGVKLTKDQMELPRALLEPLIEQLDQADLPYEIDDQTIPGKPLALEFTGTLRDEQTGLVEALANRSCGILDAATGTGKTVIGAALIARQKTSALVLVNSKEILGGWVRTLNSFLEFQNPDYEEFQAKSTKYPGKIGVLQAQTNTLTGRIDVAMIPSLVNRKDLEALLGQYGLILFDECHHAAASNAQAILQANHSRLVYGFSATPKRSDGLFAKVYWQLGPVVSRFSSKDQMAGQSFSRKYIARFTAFAGYGDTELNDFTRLTQEASLDPIRNARILADVLSAIEQDRTVLVLTKFIEHARLLAKSLRQMDPSLNLLVYAGDPKEKAANQEKLKELADQKRVVLVGTYSSIGEGFDFPPLDTLMLALPVKSQVSISQAIGRIHRQTKAKKEVLVYDYVDEMLSMLKNMYEVRRREYKKQGYVQILPIEPIHPLPKAYQPLEFTLDQAMAPLAADLIQTQSRFTMTTRSLSDQEEARLLGFLDLLPQPPHQPVRIDLFVESISKEQFHRLAKRQVNVHIHERIVERYLILDQNTIWYGPILKTGSQSESDLAGIALQRLENARLANDLLDLRRKEERRLRKKASEENPGLRTVQNSGSRADAYSGRESGRR